MTFHELLQTNLDKILFDATEFLSRSNLEHYNQMNVERLRAKLARLYYVARECAETNKLEPIKKYMAEITPNRYESGFELYEVQTAINILEECFWKNIVDRVDPEERMPALVKTQEILCAAKNTLAKSYLELKNEA